MLIRSAYNNRSVRESVKLSGFPLSHAYCKCTPPHHTETSPCGLKYTMVTKGRGGPRGTLHVLGVGLNSPAVFPRVLCGSRWEINGEADLTDLCAEVSESSLLYIIKTAASLRNAVCD